MLNVLITIWTLIGIITGGAILLSIIVAIVAGIIEGVKND